MPEPNIMNVETSEFAEKAFRATGVIWQFNRLTDGSYRCCIESCRNVREYGFWTCRNLEHRLLELSHFDPVNNLGNLFWSHQGKKSEIKQLRCLLEAKERVRV